VLSPVPLNPKAGRTQNPVPKKPTRLEPNVRQTDGARRRRRRRRRRRPARQHQEAIGSRRPCSAGQGAAPARRRSSTMAASFSELVGTHDWWARMVGTELVGTHAARRPDEQPAPVHMSIWVTGHPFTCPSGLPNTPSLSTHLLSSPFRGYRPPSPTNPSSQFLDLVLSRFQAGTTLSILHTYTIKSQIDQPTMEQ
jgi:hypothetical protein